MQRKTPGLLFWWGRGMPSGNKGGKDVGVYEFNDMLGIHD